MSDEYSDFRVLETKIEALTEIVKLGFGKIDVRFDRFDDRVARLETEVATLREFRAAELAKEEARLKAQEDDEKGNRIDWTKIVLALVSVLAVALAIIGQLIGGNAG